MGAPRAARGRGRRADGRRRRRSRRPRGSSAALAAARRARPSCSSSWTSGCTAPARRPPRARSRSRRRSRACRPSRSPASAATRATAAATRRPIRARVAEVDALLRETRDAFARAGPALRPHLGRLDADALPHARDLRQRAALGHLRAARPQRRAARALRAVGRGDRHLRRRARPDRDRRGLEDAHLRHRIPTAATARSSACPDADLHTINEEHGYVDVVDARRAPGARRSPAGHPEPRLRLRQPARRACWRCATASSIT